jgi:hypothetical protein
VRRWPAVVALAALAACGAPQDLAAGHSASIGCGADGNVHVSATQYNAASYSIDGGAPVAFTGGFSLTLSGTAHTVKITADDWPTFLETAGPCEQPTTTTVKVTTTTAAATTTTIDRCPPEDEPCTPGTVNVTTTTGPATSTTAPATTTTGPPGATTTTGPSTTTTTTTAPPGVTTTTLPPTFTFGAAATVCIREVPTIRIEFRNQFPSLAGQTGTLTMAALNGTVVSTQPLVYQPGATVDLLYPGTRVNADGTIADVPGWNLNAAGFWVRDPSDEFLRDGIVLTYTVNPTATATVTYPPESANCANPDGPFPPGPPPANPRPPTTTTPGLPPTK